MARLQACRRHAIEWTPFPPWQRFFARSSLLLPGSSQSWRASVHPGCHLSRAWQAPPPPSPASAQPSLSSASTKPTMSSNALTVITRAISAAPAGWTQPAGRCRGGTNAVSAAEATGTPPHRSHRPLLPPPLQAEEVAQRAAMKKKMQETWEGAAAKCERCTVVGTLLLSRKIAARSATKGSWLLPCTHVKCLLSRRRMALATLLLHACSMWGVVAFSAAAQ